MVDSACHYVPGVIQGLLIGSFTSRELSHILRSCLSHSQFLSDPAWLPGFVLDPLKLVTWGFWGQVSAENFFFLLLFLLQQLFGFRPLLGMERTVVQFSVSTLPGLSQSPKSFTGSLTHSRTSAVTTCPPPSPLPPYLLPVLRCPCVPQC